MNQTWQDKPLEESSACQNQTTEGLDTSEEANRESLADSCKEPCTFKIKHRPDSQ